MRASKKRRAVVAQRSGAGSQEPAENHISGAEGIHEEPEVSAIVNGYVRRALAHSRGKPDRIVITIEKISRKPESLSALPVTTLENRSPREAERQIKMILKKIGISGPAVSNALSVLKGDKTMRGASLISVGSGRRIEPDRERGIRVSRLGITKSAARSLSLQLSRHGINTEAVKEALILASKVAACKQVRAELCISDDPDYTTGYLASDKYGYVRIPNIKRKGSLRGGRVFFIQDEADREVTIRFLEEIPAVITGTSGFRGVHTLDEIIGFYHS